MDIQESHIADRYTKGAAAGSKTVRTKPIKRRHKASTIIANGEFEVPQEFLDEVEGIADGQPLMMVGDMESYILSVTLLHPQTRLVRVSLVIPDKPGAIARVAEVMQRNGVNMVSLESEVLVFYESMTLDIVADISAAGIGPEMLKSALEETFTMEKGRYFVDQLESIDL